MTSPDVVPGLDTQIAQAGLARGDYPQHVAARIGLKMDRYSLIRHANRVTCPALVQIAAQHAVTARAVAEKAAKRMAGQPSTCTGAAASTLTSSRTLRLPRRPTRLPHRARTARSDGRGPCDY
ncbi:MAG: hypothetical protein NVS3B26_18390 [Mycobacteriales bacterium]